METALVLVMWESFDKATGAALTDHSATRVIGFPLEARSRGCRLGASCGEIAERMSDRRSIGCERTISETLRYVKQKVGHGAFLPRPLFDYCSTSYSLF